VITTPFAEVSVITPVPAVAVKVWVLFFNPVSIIPLKATAESVGEIPSLLVQLANTIKAMVKIPKFFK